MRVDDDEVRRSIRHFVSTTFEYQVHHAHSHVDMIQARTHVDNTYKPMHRNRRTLQTHIITYTNIHTHATRHDVSQPNSIIKYITRTCSRLQIQRYTHGLVAKHTQTLTYTQRQTRTHKRKHIQTWTDMPRRHMKTHDTCEHTKTGGGSGHSPPIHIHVSIYIYLYFNKRMHVGNVRWRG